MRLLRNLIVNLFVLVLWPLRALLRLLLAPRAPPLVSVLLKGPLRYRTPARAGLLRFGARPVGLSLERLDALAERVLTAPRCLGLWIELRGATGTAAQWTELERILGRLKAGGKKVAVYAESLSGTGYAAVCGADLIALPPSGDLQLVGVGTELISAGAALQKLGVRPRFARREGFKTAPELFTEPSASPAQRETLDRLLDRSFAALRDGLSKRGLAAAAATAAIDAGPYSGRTALAAGLISQAVFRDQVPALFRLLVAAKPVPEGRAEGLPPAAVLERTSRLAPLRLRPIRPARSVAYVPLSGVIASGESRNMLGLGAVIGSETAVAALAAARKDRRCPAALVAIDSRGGGALASEVIWRELTRLSAEKPTLVYIDSMAASGGYLIACGAPRILCGPLAIVGSIGVFMGHFDLSGLLARLGIQREFVGRGARAGLNRTGALTDVEWAAIEGLADDVYGSFMKIVADARKKSPEAVRELAQGKIYSGTQAKAHGLVDEVCGHREALRDARRLGQLPEDAELRVFGDLGAGGLAGLVQRLTAGVLDDALRLGLGKL